MAAECDVVVVGYGPTGMVTAALLGQARASRGGAGEVSRPVQHAPRGDLRRRDDAHLRAARHRRAAAAAVRPQQTYQWCNGAGEILLEQRFDLEGRSGWAEWYMMYQPDLEDALDAVCRGMDEVDIRQGCAVTAITRSADVARSRTCATGCRAAVTARFVIGCDGGGSFTRDHLGIDQFDYGFAEPWMVCDFALKQPGGPADGAPGRRPGGSPPRSSRSACGTTGSASCSTPLDDFAEQSEPARVWRRVVAYLTPEDAELIRVATYTFRSLVADRWRAGNVLLAGDARTRLLPRPATAPDQLGLRRGGRWHHGIAGQPSTLPPSRRSAFRWAMSSFTASGRSAPSRKSTAPSLPTNG